MEQHNNDSSFMLTTFKTTLVVLTFELGKKLNWKDGGRGVGPVYHRLGCSEGPSGLTSLTSFRLQFHVVVSWLLPLSLFTLFSLSLSNQLLFSFLPPKSSLGGLQPYVF